MKKPARSTGLIGRVQKALMIMVMMIAKDMSARAVMTMSAIADTITIIMVLNLEVVISAFLQTNVVVRRCEVAEVCGCKDAAGSAGTAIKKVRLKCAYLDKGLPEIAQRNLVNGCSGK